MHRRSKNILGLSSVQSKSSFWKTGDKNLAVLKHALFTCCIIFPGHLMNIKQCHIVNVVFDSRNALNDTLLGFFCTLKLYRSRTVSHDSF